MAWRFKSDWVASPRNPNYTDLDNLAKDQGRSGTGSWGGDVDAGGFKLLNTGGVSLQGSPDVNYGNIKMVANGNSAGISWVATNGASTSRNWQFQSNYFAVGSLDIMRSSGGGVSSAPTTHVASFNNQGFLGIGYSAPGFLLSLGTSTVQRKFAIYDNGATYYGIGIDVNAMRFEAGSNIAGSPHTTGGFNFYTNADTGTTTPAFTITPAGRVGIGKTPGSVFGVVGLSTYADRQTAINNGLTSGDCYVTAAGALMVV
jgi:hypothetical protein